MSSRWENITNFLPYFWPMEQPNVFTCSGMTLAKLPAREPLMDSILYLGIFLTVWKFSLREPGTVSSLCPSAGICWLAAKQREVKERSLFLMASLGWWWERESERETVRLYLLRLQATTLRPCWRVCRRHAVIQNNGGQHSFLLCYCSSTFSPLMCFVVWTGL